VNLILICTGGGHPTSGSTGFDGKFERRVQMNDRMQASIRVSRGARPNHIAHGRRSLKVNERTMTMF